MLGSLCPSSSRTAHVHEFVCAWVCVLCHGTVSSMPCRCRCLCSAHHRVPRGVTSGTAECWPRFHTRLHSSAPLHSCTVCVVSMPHHISCNACRYLYVHAHKYESKRVKETGVHASNIWASTSVDVGLLSHTHRRHFKFLSVAACLRGLEEWHVVFVRVCVCVCALVYDDALWHP